MLVLSAAALSDAAFVAADDDTPTPTLERAFNSGAIKDEPKDLGTNSHLEWQSLRRRDGGRAQATVRDGQAVRRIRTLDCSS